MIDARLATLGVGIFGAHYVGDLVTGFYEQQSLPLTEYARIVVGVGMGIGGTMLVKDRKARWIGTAIGATGFAIAARGILDVFGQEKAAVPTAQPTDLTPHTDRMWRAGDLFRVDSR